MSTANFKEHTTKISENVENATLTDKEQFENINDNTSIYFEPFQSNYKSIKFHIDESDNGEESQDIDGIYYDEFAKNMRIPELKNSNEVVIQMSYADISFEEICVDMMPIFRIHADNESFGFTRAELLTKLFEIYHMLYFIYKNYNMQNGLISANMNNVKWKNRCFRPLIGDYDYESNGIYSLEFNKQRGIWIVQFLHYH